MGPSRSGVNHPGKGETNRLVATGSLAAGDAGAIEFFRQAIAEGRHWYLALLGAIGLWSSSQEVIEDRTYQYLIDGEAFDWLLLAERLCDAVDGLLPEDEKNALLFHGEPPLELTGTELRELIGDHKYGQYLNYFYGITAEEALVLEVQEEIDKERRLRGLGNSADSGEEVYLRIYGASREVLLKSFRKEKGYPQRRSTTLGELKAFAYWLFKYRLRHCEKARIASDTRKALDYLNAQRRKSGISRAPVTGLSVE